MHFSLSQSDVELVPQTTQHPDPAIAYRQVPAPSPPGTADDADFQSKNSIKHEITKGSGCRRGAQVTREHGSPRAAEILRVFADSYYSVGNRKASSEGGQKGTEEQQRQPRTDGLCDQQDSRTSASWPPAVSYSKVARGKGSARSAAVRRNGLTPCPQRLPACFFLPFPTGYVWKVLPHSSTSENGLL